MDSSADKEVQAAVMLGYYLGEWSEGSWVHEALRTVARSAKDRSDAVLPGCRDLMARVGLRPPSLDH